MDNNKSRKTVYKSKREIVHITEIDRTEIRTKDTITIIQQRSPIFYLVNGAIIGVSVFLIVVFVLGQIGIDFTGINQFMGKFNNTFGFIGNLASIISFL